MGTMSKNNSEAITSGKRPTWVQLYYSSYSLPLSLQVKEDVLKGESHCILRFFSWYNTTFKLTKTKNNSFLRYKKTKEIIINHKEPRMVKLRHGLLTLNLKNLI